MLDEDADYNNMRKKYGMPDSTLRRQGGTPQRRGLKLLTRPRASGTHGGWPT
jgi:hypothetical protein